MVDPFVGPRQSRQGGRDLAEIGLIAGLVMTTLATATLSVSDMVLSLLNAAGLSLHP